MKNIYMSAVRDIFNFLAYTSELFVKNLILNSNLLYIMGLFSINFE